MSITVTSKEDKLLIDKKLDDLEKKGKFDSRKHVGTIELKESPIKIQEKMRDEW
ncbi:MAG: hypothetical protein IPO92_08800 [Saprospiraceae bacterium]|nr:hypothetical protein [Saprospiraceae bacterium]